MCVACSANEGIEKKVILIRVFGFSFEEMGATFFIKKTEYIFIKEKEKYWKKEIDIFWQNWGFFPKELCL